MVGIFTCFSGGVTTIDSTFAPATVAGNSANTGFDVGFRDRPTIGVGGFGSTSREWSEYGAKATVGLRF